MERDVKVGETDYKIVIGFGAYHRVRTLTGIAIMDRPEMRENIPEKEKTDDWEETASEKADTSKEDEEHLNAALRSEGLLDKNERVKDPATLGDDADVFKLIEMQEQLGGKSTAAKLRILELTVRDGKRKKLSKDYFEEGLDPLAGEELFGLVMETMEELTSEIEDKERSKNS